MAHPVINVAEYERGGIYCQQTGTYSGDFGVIKAIGTANANLIHISSSNISNFMSGCSLTPNTEIKGRFQGFVFNSGNLVAYYN